MTTTGTGKRARRGAGDTVIQPATDAAAPSERTASTAAPAAEPPRLSDAQVASVLNLLKKVDSVELKVTVPVDLHRATIRGLPVDPVEARPRQVFFFDTPELDLDRAGLIVRARRGMGGQGDTVVKLRPVEPDDLPLELRQLNTFNIEVDVLPGGFMCSASFKGVSDSKRVRDGVTGVLPVRKLFTKDQRAFFDRHAPTGVTLDQLSVLGPTFLLKSTFYADFGGRDQRMAAELWLYPDGSRILELSLRCPPKQAFQVGAEARTYLASRGIHADPNQTPKTRTALAFYAELLKAQRGEVTEKAASRT